MPKPLYLSREVVERAAFDQQGALAGLQDAAEQSDRALRAAQAPATALPAAAPETEIVAEPAARPTRVASTPANRFAAMGIVDADNSATPNIDEVLRRRRQAAS